MQWLFDIVLEMVADAGYALKSWVLEQQCKSTCRVYRNGSQSIPSGVWTKILFNAESWDVNSEFANYKFTAKEAGYFQVCIATVGRNISAGRRWQVGIYKNGGMHTQSVNRAVATGYAGTQIADILYLNGTTDYIEGRVFHDDSAARDIYAHTWYTFMSIHQLSKDT